MTTMHPIDTAPRDGTTILLADKTGNFADGYWLAEAHKGKGAWIWPYLRREPAFWGQLPCRPSKESEIEKRSSVKSRAWDAVMRDERLGLARKRMSLYELRTLIEVVQEAMTDTIDTDGRN